MNLVIKLSLLELLLTRRWWHSCHWKAWQVDLSWHQREFGRPVVFGFTGNNIQLTCSPLPHYFLYEFYNKMISIWNRFIIHVFLLSICLLKLNSFYVNSHNVYSVSNISSLYIGCTWDMLKYKIRLYCVKLHPYTF